MRNLCNLCLAIAFSAGISVHAETIAPTTGNGIIQLSELDGIENITFLAGEHVYANRSTKNNPITIEGNVYESGIGTHAPSVAVVELNGATSFHAILGVDDGADLSADHGIVDYEVTLYGSSLTDSRSVCSGTLNRQNPTYSYVLDIDNLRDYSYLRLEFKKGAQPWADHADWADARFTYEGTAPRLVAEDKMFRDESRIVSLPTQPNTAGAQILPLSSLDIAQVTTGWGQVRKDRSVDNNPLRIKGYEYTSGIGMHASGKVVVKLNGSVTEFHALLGIDDEVAAAATANKSVSSVEYRVILRKPDGKEEVKKSGIINYNDAEAAAVDLTDISGYKYMILEFDDYNGNASDHVDIANAYFEFLYQNSTPPEIVNESVIATGIFAATQVFAQPGVKFMQKIRSQNEDAILSVSDLPAGLVWNSERNLVEGIIDTEGTYTYNAHIAVGDERSDTTITLTVSNNLKMPTPFMGWLSWNVVQGEISNKVVEDVTDNMVSFGLVKAGYNYLIIDDLWHAPSRNADGTPAAHPDKFPKGIKAAADYVHANGMFFGNYSDVANRTCAGAFGSLGYEAIDAKQYSEWGIDIVKVDFCGQESQNAVRAKELYSTFTKELDKYGITLYMCEWGVREPWKWGAETGAPTWRSTYDTRDCWNGASGGIGILQSIAGMKDIYMYNGVNRWNDADMMCVGIHGTGKSSSDLCASGAGMTQDEYRTQFALWCMWSSPLTLSFDLRKPIGDDDLRLMTNSDLIAINQDRLGQAGEPLLHNADFFVMAKDLENGDVAVSVTNLSASALNYTFNFAEVPGLDAETTYTVRDLQKQTNCPDAAGSLVVNDIPSHATAVFRLSSEPQSGINSAAVADALESMTAARQGDSIRVCLPGTGGAAKRIIVCDVAGRVIATAQTVGQCASLQVPERGTYVINAVCASRSHTLKLTL